MIIDQEQLLSRVKVDIPFKENLSYLKDKRILITGAGGSVGSELCRQIVSIGAKRLYLFGHGENSIFKIEKELLELQKESVGDNVKIVSIIGELQDKHYIKYIIKKLKVDIIFHAAAHKHLHLMENNQVESIKNNVFGTKNLINASLNASVSKFIFISTDKAVNPSCTYGVSKHLAEELVLSVGNNNYKVVRFGNVLGSRGSILPIFKKQIKKGGPVTVTHPKVKRYFMTINEAARLVLKAGEIEIDNKLLLLDMGNPVLIKDIAKQLIKMYGYIPNKDIDIIYTGLKDGEKMDEILYPEDAKPIQTKYKKILKLDKELLNSGILNNMICKLQDICYFNPDKPELFRNKYRLKDVLKSAI